MRAPRTTSSPTTSSRRAFGGSFLNHQWLIAARAPLRHQRRRRRRDATRCSTRTGCPTTLPAVHSRPAPSPTASSPRTCGAPAANDYATACGDFAVNTIQPASRRRTAAARSSPLIDDTRYPNIGDRLTDAGIRWNWYSGGWDDADAGHPGPLFQYHHQPFNYFADYAPGQPGRAHLQDETKFIAAADGGHAAAGVSFVKPYGAENEHPGYASEPDGSDHLVDLLKTITNGPQAKNTLIVVTYDEFGGQWDHVAPPGSPSTTWGPGTRIPALVLVAAVRDSGVDHTTYDTTSILATIEKAFHLEPLGTRDAQVNPLFIGIRMGLDG